MFEQMLIFALVIQIFVLLNPLSSFPVLLAAHKQRMDVPKIASQATLVAFIVALGVIMFGPALFSLYGVSVDSFRIAGGVVLFLLGIETTRAGEEIRSVGEIDGLISIIATPLLTGPAVISFLVLKSYEIGQVALAVNTTLAFVLSGTVFYVFALLIPRINPKAVVIVSKVMGLFLTALAIEMIAKGSLALFVIKPV